MEWFWYILTFESLCPRIHDTSLDFIPHPQVSDSVGVMWAQEFAFLTDSKLCWCAGSKSTFWESRFWREREKKEDKLRFISFHTSFLVEEWAARDGEVERGQQCYIDGCSSSWKETSGAENKGSLQYHVLSFVPIIQQPWHHQEPDPWGGQRPQRELVGWGTRLKSIKRPGPNTQKSSSWTYVTRGRPLDVMGVESKPCSP